MSSGTVRYVNALTSGSKRKGSLRLFVVVLEGDWNSIEKALQGTVLDKKGKDSKNKALLLQGLWKSVPSTGKLPVC